MPRMPPIAPMIQKRKVICVSAQPSRSKWWWIGVKRKMRLPVSLTLATCKITEPVSTTKMMPISGRSST